MNEYKPLEITIQYKKNVVQDTKTHNFTKRARKRKYMYNFKFKIVKA